MIFNLMKSLWPVLMSFALFNLLLSVIFSLKLSFFMGALLLSTAVLLMNMYLWGKDLSRESSFSGSLSLVMSVCMKTAFMLFIVSEIMFFLSFFWAYFHFMLNPPAELIFWPPYMLTAPSFKTLALLNTIILLSSGFTITNSHQFLLINKTFGFIFCNICTIMLSISFLVSQNVEYSLMMVMMTDSVFSSSFYVTTMFHGIHVFVGSVLIILSSTEIKFNFFEVAAWYWHFVDVVWLLLFLFFYWWISP